MKLRRLLSIMLSLAMLFGMVPMASAAGGDGSIDDCSHVYEAVITAPTCTEQGYTTHTCTVCGDSYIDSYTEADTLEGHDYVGGVCSLCGHSVLGADWLAPDFAQGDYTMVALPDTQNMVKYWPKSFYRLTSWVADNKDSLNIKAVMHMGDMVNDDTAAQWDVLKTGMDIIDASGIAWMPMRGNHDPSAGFNAAFPYETYGTEQSWFGGSYHDGTLDHTYWFVTAGQREYLIFSLGWAPSWEVLGWVKDIAAAHPEKSVILTTHALMAGDGSLLDEGESGVGSYMPGYPNSSFIKAAFAECDNLVLAMCGHVHSENIIVRNDLNGAGELMSSMLLDYQNKDVASPHGVVALLTFHEDSDQVDVNWYSTYYDALYRSKNQFSISVPHVHEHSWDEGVITTEPTETTEGVKTFTCTICGETKTEAVEAISIIASGSCGDALTWTLNSAGTLTISGAGSMNYEGAVPWADHRDSITELIVEPGVTDIHEYAFWYCQNLKSASLPEGLVSIGQEAFENCAALESVTIPASVEFIGYRAFYDCGVLEEIHFIGNAPSCDGHIFGCSATVYYPAENATWNGKANYETYGGVLAWVDSGAEVADETLYYGSCGDGVNWKLSTLGTLTIYGDGAMDNYDISAIEAVYPPWVMKKAMIERLVIESGVKTIGEEALYNCRNLVDVSLAEGLESVGSGAFENCEKLTSISFPESLNYIDEAVFWGCDALKSVTFTSDDLTIDGSMFGKNFVLEELNFTGNAPTFDTIAFHLVTATIYYPAANATWNGKTTDYSGTLTWVDNGIVPDEEVFASGSCGNGITWELTNFGKLTIRGEGYMPDSGYSPTFWDEWELSVENVVIEEGILNILEGLFASCEYMESVSIPTTVKSIGQEAFTDCGSLKSVTIPAAVSYIGIHAFENCAELKEIIFEGPAPEIYAEAFKGVTATVQYPARDSSWEGVAGENYGGTLTWIAADNGHDHSYTETVTAPTCTEKGYTTYTCVCGESYTDSETEALGHNWSEPVYVAPFRINLICLECGEEVKNFLVEKEHDHSYVAEVTKPTCLEGGYTTYTCSCTKTYVADKTPATDHDFTGGVCTACGYSVLGGDWLAPDFAEGDYTMVAIPDTQSMVKYWPEEYRAQMQWIADNKTAMNIQAVLHMGDMVQDDAQSQWATAKSGTDILDAAGVVWMPMRGNHDDSTMFNSCYPYATYGSGRSYFGGSYEEGKLDHYYSLITVGNREYVIINLGWMPTVLVLNWAKGIVEEHSDKNVIISCHAYMNDDGTPLSWESDMSDDMRNELIANLPEGTTMEMAMMLIPDGDDIWAAFKGYENVVLALSGHVNSKDIIKYTDKNGAGKDVSSLLIDRQNDDIADRLGMVALLSFHEDSDTVELNWYSTRYDALYKAKNQFSITVPHTVAEESHSHSYSETVTAPTCTEKGYTTYTCSCGESYNDNYTDSLGHKWDEGKVTKAATEESEGVKTYTCTVCSETKTESIPVLEHVHRYTEAVTEPSCDEKGYTGYTCSCGESYKDKYTDALGHKWGKSEITKEPTADAEGEKTYTCTECGDTMTEKLEKLPDCGGKHSWDKGKVSKEPTNKEEGEMRYSCTECGDTMTEKIARLPDVDDFKDVAKRDYFYDSVKWALEEGITTGTAKDKFSPSALCTRAQVVTFLWRAAGEPVARNTNNPFSDVKEGEYYYDAVLWALENGITGGISKELFAPDAPCTRAQVVTFLWRAAGEPKPDGGKNPFTDVAEGQYYYDAVLWAVEQGITKGLTISVFGSDASCTRAQIVTFLCRAFTR